MLPITNCVLAGGEAPPPEEAKFIEALPRRVFVIVVAQGIDSQCLPKLSHDLEHCSTQVFIMHDNKSNVVRVDLEHDTVATLKRKVYSKTGVPTDRQSLNYGGKLLTSEANLLQMYGVGANSNVTMNVVPSKNEGGWGYSSNFSGTNLQTLMKQSAAGVRQFRSALYVLVGRTSGQELTRLLAVVREFSGNNAPLVSALHRLAKNTTLLFTEKIALEEGFLTLFSKMLASSKQVRENVLQKRGDRTFEFSRACFAALIKASKEPSGMPERWSDIEKYESHDFTCPVSMKKIEEVVGLKLDSGKVEWCDRIGIVEKQASNSKVNGVAQVPVPDSLLSRPANANFYLQLYKALNQTSGWLPFLGAESSINPEKVDPKLSHKAVERSGPKRPPTSLYFRVRAATRVPTIWRRRSWFCSTCRVP